MTTIKMFEKFPPAVREIFAGPEAELARETLWECADNEGFPDDAGGTPKTPREIAMLTTLQAIGLVIRTEEGLVSSFTNYRATALGHDVNRALNPVAMTTPERSRS